MPQTPDPYHFIESPLKGNFNHVLANKELKHRVMEELVRAARRWSRFEPGLCVSNRKHCTVVIMPRGLMTRAAVGSAV